MVRSERAPTGEIHRAVEQDVNSFAVVQLPQFLRDLISQIPHRDLALPDGCAWTFPLRSYAQVLETLLDIANATPHISKVAPIPGWVSELAGLAVKTPVAHLELHVPDARLLPYQLEGVKFALRRGGRCLIGDEMGLGKTVQALTIVAQYEKEWPVLVICPASLRWVWQEQLEEWLSTMVSPVDIQVVTSGAESLRSDAKFWIVSYGMLASDGNGQGDKFSRRPDGSNHRIVVVDECHSIKNWQAQRTKVVVPLIQKASRAVLLSGTATRNSPEELHPQLAALLPGLGLRFSEFCQRYCVQQSNHIQQRRVVGSTVGGKNMEELNHLLTSSVMVRRLKKDVLRQLPPIRRRRVPLEVGDGEMMRDIRNLQWEWEHGNHRSAATLFQKLAVAKAPAVKVYLQEVLDKGNDKAIIFAHHRSMLTDLDALLAEILPEGGCRHIRIDGSTPTKLRPDLVQQFQTDPACRVALLSITACGEGLTLTAAGHVLFAELYWVPGVIEQAEARAHRIGTCHNKVLVEFLVVRHSPDERIYARLEQKKHDTSSVLNGIAESFSAPQELLQNEHPEFSCCDGTVSTQNSSPSKNSSPRRRCQASALQPISPKSVSSKLSAVRARILARVRAVAA